MDSMHSVVADESVDYRVIVELRNSRFNVYSILEKSPGIDDEKVLKKTQELDSILITEDKDFGELVIRLKKNHAGVVLVRIHDSGSINNRTRLCRILKDHITEMKNNISVITEEKLRIRSL
ncbi:MAG: hypothetical protein CL666_14195 [Balneola sp.]|nr:hypothetical protein [Balneola sp.]|tara:strand:+ start:1607 stop:1969 length:363 start_codon:yes stop_codon:yes gene_type:complete